jgi:S1-C subfamily serine protease
MNHESKSIFGAVIASIVTTVVVVTLIASVVMNNRVRVAEMLLGTTNTSSSTQVVPSTTGAVEIAVKKANPAVVSIIITKNEPVIERYYTYVPGPFGSLRVPQYRQNGTSPQEVGGGSGFLVSADGLIATNAHVVDDAEAQYTVYTNDGKKHAARVVAKDEMQDIALIKIQGNNFPFLSFGSSKDLQLGQSVIAIGNALSEFRNTVSVGVVSGLSRSITAGSYSTGETEQLNELIQTDAAINPGNSGGPLLDLNGNVIGMNVAVAASSQSIGFALPGDLVKNAVESVKAKGYISRPYVGVRYVEVNESIKETYKLSVDYGVLVMKGDGLNEPAVIPNSPAAKAGIVEGDVIVEFNGTQINEDQKLANLILKQKIGDKVSLKVLHNGQTKNLTVTIGELNSAQ